MANRIPFCDEIFSEDGILCRTALETRAAARKLAAKLPPDATLCLDGPLGAGKTCFVQGLAEALGGDPADVSSPTFTIVHEYLNGGLIHIDLYRINSEEELITLGFEEYLAAPAVRAIEWGGKFPGILPPATIHIAFDIEGSSRRIRGGRTP
jgi:tRNA threonylcarbamoyladenosine biosynthesis protein TsaE